jgi:hypothetical protein
MKLLSRAIWTASLTEIVVRPLLRTTCVEPDGDWVVSAPSSLQRSTGSVEYVSIGSPSKFKGRLTVWLFPVQYCANILVEGAEQDTSQCTVNFTRTLLTK